LNHVGPGLKKGERGEEGKGEKVKTLKRAKKRGMKKQAMIKGHLHGQEGNGQDGSKVTIQGDFRRIRCTLTDHVKPQIALKSVGGHKGLKPVNLSKKEDRAQRDKRQKRLR